METFTYEANASAKNKKHSNKSYYTEIPYTFTNVFVINNLKQ